MNENQIKFVELCEAAYGKEASLTRAQIIKLSTENGVMYPQWLKAYKTDRNVYKVPSIEEIRGRYTSQSKIAPVEMAKVVNIAPQQKAQNMEEFVPHIPETDENFIPFGFFKDLVSIMKSKSFYPIFISGHHGSGKTQMVEQVCAQAKREMIRVNISIETDETDLIGGPTLRDGNVIHVDGPVIVAMRRGSILLLDEMDRGSNKMLAIMGILEGKPFFNKKTGETIHPASGFNVVATTNTKGSGSDEGKYLAQILDTAFLERFPITVEHNYPDAKTETKILNKLTDDTDFVEKLVRWAGLIRTVYEQGALDDFISTRRLIHIVKAFGIFKNKMKAIELCVNRFDTDTKNSFIEFYTKIDSGVTDLDSIMEKMEQPVDEKESDF